MTYTPTVKCSETVPSSAVETGILDNASLDSATAQEIHYEERMREGQITDAQALQDIVGWEPDRRARLGAFIGQCLEPCSFLDTFHTCWPDLPQDCQDALIRKFTVERPEAALMVAPFVDLTGCKLLAHRCPTTGFTPNILSVHFDRIETFKTLIEITLAKAPEAIINNVIRHYLLWNAALITPYIPEAVKLNHITKDVATKHLQELHSHLYAVIRSFRTNHEQRELDQLDARGQRLQEEQGQEDNWRPHNLYDIRSKIEAPIRERAAKHLLTDTAAWLDFISSDERLLLYRECISRRIPILTYPEKLNLTDEELKQLIRDASTEIKDLFVASDCSDLKACIRAGLGEEVVNYLCACLKAEPDCELIPAMLENLESLLEELTPAEADRLVGTLTEEAPLLWCQRLDFMLEKKLMKVDELIAKLHEKPDFYYNSMALLNGLQRLEQTGHRPQPGSADFIRSLRDRIEAKPALYFETSLGQSVFGGQWISDLLNQHTAANKDHTLLGYLLEEIGRGRLREHLPAVRSWCLAHSGTVQRLLREATYPSSIWDGVRETLGLEERLNILISKQGRVQWKAILRPDTVQPFWAAQDLVRSARHLSLMLNRLQNGRNAQFRLPCSRIFTAMLKEAHHPRAYAANSAVWNPEQLQRAQGTIEAIEKLASVPLKEGYPELPPKKTVNAVRQPLPDSLAALAHSFISGLEES